MVLKMETMAFAFSTEHIGLLDKACRKRLKWRACREGLEKGILRKESTTRRIGTRRLNLAR